MKENAEKASKNSGDAAKAAQDSREEIANGRMMQRPSSSLESRRKAFEALLSADTFEEKAVEATAFMKAFEFQVWTGQKYDSESYLQELYSVAIQELFRRLPEANHGKIISESKMKALRVVNRTKNYSVMALSGALHKLGPLQDVAVQKFSWMTKPTSMYDLIAQGLRQHKKLETGEIHLSQLKDYEYYVSFYQEEAVALIQARVNIIMALVLKQVSRIHEDQVEAARIFIGRSFNSRFHILSQTKKNEAIKRLKYAKESIELLKEIDEDLGLQPELLRAYEKMKLPESLDASSDDHSKTKVMEFKYILGQISDLIN